MAKSGVNTALVVAVALLCGLQLASAGVLYDARKPIFNNTQSYIITYNNTGAAPTNISGAVTYSALTPFNQSIPNTRILELLGCGATGIHIHPRATEHIYVISGKVAFGLFFEDGSFQEVTFNQGCGGVIPIGTIHYARNLQKYTASRLFVYFDHPDPGTTFIAPALTRFDKNVVLSNFVTTQTTFFNATTGTNFKVKGCS